MIWHRLAARPVLIGLLVGEWFITPSKSILVQILVVYWHIEVAGIDAGTRNGGVTPSLEIAEALAAALDVHLVDLLDPRSEAVHR